MVFDYLKCEYPLPDPHMQDCEFQTKDTPEQFLYHYTITAKGRLVFHDVRLEEVPGEDWPHVRQVPLGDVDIGFHGDISFYTCDEKGKNWREYRARFTDGQLQEIVRNS